MWYQTPVEVQNVRTPVRMCSGGCDYRRLVASSHPASVKGEAVLSKIPEDSGERYLPDKHDAMLALYHWHKYLFAAELAHDKTVLDIASGEGYGSHLLSKYARRVVGVDVSNDCVEHARAKYISGDSDNLEYLAGSALCIPIDGQHHFDLIVSLETIEHLRKEEQGIFIEEVKRLLKPDGLFVVSTPDKQVHSDKTGTLNPFHVGEFYFHELRAFLGEYFPEIRYFFQHLYPVSYIWNGSGMDSTCGRYGLGSNGQCFWLSNQDLEPMIVIAVCSAEPTVGGSSSVLLDINERFQKEKDEIYERLSAKICERDAELAVRRVQLQDKDTIVWHKDRELESVYKSKSWKITAPLRWITKVCCGR